ncbi:MAG: hypothetical protein K0S27_915 [Gammaproteobacteria bacterium]|jgi:hypothetical protein|nr:hypothetical protein [Gammaproteobacteria bacterium]
MNARPNEDNNFFDKETVELARNADKVKQDLSAKAIAHEAKRYINCVLSNEEIDPRQKAELAQAFNKASSVVKKQKGDLNSKRSAIVREVPQLNSLIMGKFANSEARRIAALMSIYHAVEEYQNPDSSAYHQYKILQDVMRNIADDLKQEKKAIVNDYAYLRDGTAGYDESLAAILMMGDLYTPQQDKESKQLLERDALAIKLKKQAESEVAPKVHHEMGDDENVRFKKQDALAALYVSLNILKSGDIFVNQTHAEKIEDLFKKFAQIQDETGEQDKFKSDPTIKLIQEDINEILEQSIKKSLTVEKGAAKEAARSTVAHLIKGLLSCDLPLENVIKAIHEAHGDKNQGLKELYYVAMHHLQGQEQEKFLMEIHKNVAMMYNIAALITDYNQQSPSIIKKTLARVILADAKASTLDERTLVDMLRNFPQEDERRSILSAIEGLSAETQQKLLTQSSALFESQVIEIKRIGENLIQAFPTQEEKKEESLFDEIFDEVDELFFGKLAIDYNALALQAKHMADQCKAENLSDVRENILEVKMQKELHAAAMNAADLIKTDDSRDAEKIAQLKSIILSISETFKNTNNLRALEKLIAEMIKDHPELAESLYAGSDLVKYKDKYIYKDKDGQQVEKEVDADMYVQRSIEQIDLNSSSPEHIESIINEIVSRNHFEEAFKFFKEVQKFYLGSENEMQEAVQEAIKKPELLNEEAPFSYSQKPGSVAAALLRNTNMVDWLLKNNNAYTEVIHAVDTLFSFDSPAYENTLNIFKKWTKEQLQDALNNQPTPWWLSWGALTHPEMVKEMSPADLAKHLDQVKAHLKDLSPDHRIALMKQLGKEARLAFVKSLDTWEDAKNMLFAGLEQHSDKEKNDMLYEMAATLTQGFEQEDVNGFTQKEAALALSFVRHNDKVLILLSQKEGKELIKKCSWSIVDELDGGFLSHRDISENPNFSEDRRQLVRISLYGYQGENSSYSVGINRLVREEINDDPSRFLKSANLQHTLKMVLSDADLVQSLSEKRDAFDQIMHVLGAAVELDREQAQTASYLQGCLVRGAAEGILSPQDLHDCITAIDVSLNTAPKEAAEEKAVTKPNPLLADLPFFIANMSLSAADEKHEADLTAARELLSRYMEEHGNNPHKRREMINKIMENDKLNSADRGYLWGVMKPHPQAALEIFSDSFVGKDEALPTSFRHMPTKAKVAFVGSIVVTALALVGIALIPVIGPMITGAIVTGSVVGAGLVASFAKDHPILTGLAVALGIGAAAAYKIWQNSPIRTERTKAERSAEFFKGVCQAHKDDPDFFNEMANALKRNQELRAEVGKAVFICKKHGHSPADYITDANLRSEMVAAADEHYYKNNPIIARIVNIATLGWMAKTPKAVIQPEAQQPVQQAEAKQEASKEVTLEGPQAQKDRRMSLDVIWEAKEEKTNLKGVDRAAAATKEKQTTSPHRSIFQRLFHRSPSTHLASASNDPKQEVTHKPGPRRNSLGG